MTVFLSVSHTPALENEISLRAIFCLVSVSLSSLSTLARAPVYKQAHSLYSAPTVLHFTFALPQKAALHMDMRLC